MSLSKRLTSKLLSIRLLSLFVGVGVVFMAATGSALALPAPTLFMTTGGTGEPSKTASPSNLYSVNPGTAQTNSVGNTGYAITGLAQDPTTGILYAISNNKSPIAPKTLLKLDPANGAATAVGPLGLIIADITFDSQGNLFGWSEENDVLAKIDKQTGAATEVAENEIGTYGSASAFDLNDTYWLFAEGEGEAKLPNEEGSYYTLDTITGKPTFKGRLSPIDSNRSSISAAAFDCARTTLYATVNNYGDPPANLVTIDTATGSLTNKGQTTTGADGLEWYCPLAFEFTSLSTEVKGPGPLGLTVPVVRGPRIKGSASVNFATQDGSAHAGRDFTATAGTLSFSNNAGSASIPLTVTPDPKAGSNRTFTVILSSPSAGGTIGTGTYTVTIKASKPKAPKIKGPKSTKAERVTFKLRSPQLPARFRCKLDKKKFKGCGKNSLKGKKFKTPKLAPGRHKLVVQVINGAGLKSKLAKKKFVVLP
jgi:Calx-beta domain